MLAVPLESVNELLLASRSGSLQLVLRAPKDESLPDASLFPEFAGLIPARAGLDADQRDALKLRALARALEACSPLATVARGYTILTAADGSLVQSVSQATPGARLQARLGDGSLLLSVDAVQPAPVQGSD